MGQWTRSVWTPRTLSVMRIMIALVFMEHGTQKMLHFPVGMPVPMPVMSQLWVAGVLELVGGLLLALGLFTRPVAFVLCGEMAVAYFQGHAPNGFYPLVNKGELAVVYCFVFLYLAVAGGGPWSLDALLFGRKREAIE